MQLSIQQIDPGLWQRLQLEAKHRGTEASDLVIIALRSFLGWPQPAMESQGNKSLDHLAGTWTEEDATAFEKETELFNQIDSELWQ